MIVQQQKARATLLARRTRAIIIFALVFVLLLSAYLVINHFIRFVPFTDVDGTEYRVVLKAGKYGLYDLDGNKLEAEDEYSYFVTDAGTLVDVDADTGRTKIVAMVDTEYGEANDTRNNLLIFPKLSKKEISSVEVFNTHGKFSFARYDLVKNRPDNSGDFVIESAPLVSYDQELFAELYVTAGYTICKNKIEDPIKDANGAYSEYGLVAEKRIDYEGNEYDYEPAYYIITDTSGNKHKLLIGDRMVTGEGYYVQYVEMTEAGESLRDAVYVLDVSIENSLLQPVEAYVTPQIVYQMSMSDYLDVEKFEIFRYEDGKDTPEHVVGFTFIPLEERQGSITANKPFIFEHARLSGFAPHVDNISDTMYNFYYTEFAGVYKLAPEAEDFVEVGLGKIIETDGEDGKASTEFEFTPKYIVSYYYDVLDGSGKKASTIKQVVFLSEANEAGNYYAYSFVYDGTDKEKEGELLYVYDMISEINGYCFDFVTWPQTKWINSNYIDYNIAFVKELDIKTKDYEASFTLDNSKTVQEPEKVSSALLTVAGKDSRGKELETFSTLTVLDVKGFTWQITPTDIAAVNKYGEASTISTAYYAYNSLGRQVRCVSGYIECYDGSRVEVSADKVIVTYANGKKEVFERYATSLFRQFYQTLLVATVVDTYDLTDEEEKALVADESKHLLTMRLKDTDGVEKTFSFYRLTSRKAYITVNGSGGFYVMTDRVEKIVSDVMNFFDLKPIDAMAKN